MDIYVEYSKQTFVIELVPVDKNNKGDEKKVEDNEKILDRMDSFAEAFGLRRQGEKGSL